MLAVALSPYIRRPVQRQGLELAGEDARASPTQRLLYQKMKKEGHLAEALVVFTKSLPDVKAQ